MTTASLVILKSIHSLLGVKSWRRRLQITRDHNYTKVKSTLSSPGAVPPDPHPTEPKEQVGLTKADLARDTEEAWFAQPHP